MNKNCDCNEANWLPVALKREWVPEWLWRITSKLVLWDIWPIRQIIATSDPAEMKRLLDKASQGSGK